MQILQKPYLSHPDSELDVYIWILIYSTRTIQCWCPKYILSNLPRPIKPGCHAGLTGSSQTCKIRVSTYAPLFLGKACVPRNIYLVLELHRYNVKHKNSKQVLLFKHDRIYQHLNLRNMKNATFCCCLCILYETNKPEYTSSVVGY
jgi:hypothetical protein